MRILLVEDNSDHRELMRLALTGHDSMWEVEAVESGEEVLGHLAEGEAYDVVLLDYSLPGRDGLEVLEEIRRGEAPPPVVMVTGRGDERVAVEAMKGGAYDYVVKSEGYLQRLPVVAQRAVEAHQLAVECKRAEEALRESEERYHELFNNMTSGVAVYEAKDNGNTFIIKEFNKGGEAIEQVKKEDILGQSVADVFSGVKEFGLFDVFQRVWKTGMPERLSETFYLDQRISGWRENYVYKLPSGEIVAVYDDITERVQAERLLRESEEKYRSLASTADSMYLVDRKCRYLFANEKHLGRLDLRGAQIIGRMYSEFHSEEDTREFAQKVKEVFETNKSIQSEHKSERDKRYFLRTYSPVKDQKGKAIIAVTVASKDITERKRAEEKLNEANLRLQMLQEITASVHSTLDLEEVFKQITDSFVYSMGYNSALIIKRNDKTNWFEVKTLSSKKWILTEVDKLLGFTLENYSFPVNIGLNAAVIAAMRGEIVIAKTAEEVLYPLISKTTCSMLQEFGGIKNYILVPLQVDKEVVGGVIITTAREEVSEEEFKMVNLFAQAASHAIQNANLHTLTQQAKEALRESEERFRLLAENARDTIWTMDMNLQYTYMSPYVKQSLDYTPEEFMAKPFNEILTPASLELCMKVLAEELEIEKRENKDLLRSRTIEVEGIHRNGNIVWAEFKMTFMRNAAGQATGILGYTRDINERKKAEEALQQSEEKYRLIAENMADVIAILDMNLRFTYISPSIMRIRGFTVEEAMEQTLDQVMTPESLKIALTAFEEEMKLEASGTADPDGIRTMEVEEYRKDGSSIWLEVSLSFLRDENQKAVGILSVSRDISERKRAEDALRKSEEYFRAITENTSDVIFIVDELGTITYTSPSIERFIGYSPDELIGTSSLDLILPDDHPRAIEDFGKALLTKEVVIPNSFRIIHKDGTERIMEGVGMNLMDNPAIAGFVMNVRDVTDRKRAEEKLRESEKMYRELYDFLPIPVYEMDLEANITSVNRAIYETFGGTEEDLKKGFRAWQLLSPEEIEKSSKNIQRLLKGEQIEGTEYTLMRLDGSVFPAIVISSVIYSNGKPVGLRGAIVDITERRQAEEERRNLETKLQRAQKMEALGLMAGGVAHDLNNMLSAFVSLPELMLMDIPEKNQKLRREIQMIMSSGQRTAAIVDDLLTITRGVTMARDVLNLNKVVQEYMRSPEFQKLRQFHPGIEVVTELADDLLPIRGSRVHLMKALMNLVSNASEAFRSSDSGVVSVSTQNRYVDTPLEGYERINIGEYAVLVVRDNGLGISPEDMERIFEPFYTKKVMGRSGTGLGLSVVWNTVTGHDGYIHVESGSGGTGFELYFPITRESVSEQEKPLDLKQYQGRGEKVLVVDDELDQRVIAVDILSKLGYQADAVSGGQEALEFLKEHEVDILLLDMVMPGMDGCETFRRIVQLKPGQKAVIASGFSLSDRVKKAQGLGAGAYIRKPYSVEKLGLAIKTKLDKSL